MKFWGWFFKCYFLPVLLLAISGEVSNIETSKWWSHLLRSGTSTVFMIAALEYYRYICQRTKLNFFTLGED
jgi:hypothetical protein